jgi:phage baseplate assembly protein W
VIDFLGRGAQHPFRFSPAGGVSVSEGAGPEHAHIHESIWQILSTRPGERFFLPEFGSRLPELLFQQNNVVFRALARQFIVDAIRRWERRVVIESVEFSEDPSVADRNIALIKLTYRIIRTQVRGNLVYPFAREV